MSPAGLRRAIATGGGGEDWLERLVQAVRKLQLGVPIEELVSEIDYLGRPFRWDSRSCFIRDYSSSYVAQIIEAYRGRQVRILDVGCGAGHVIISLALELEGCFVGTDISEQAIELARENAARYAAPIELYNADLFKAVRDRRFDIILANLPREYPATARIEPEETEFEPDVSIMDRSGQLHGLLIKFSQQACDYLMPGGVVYLELPSGIANHPSTLGEPLVAIDGEVVGRRLTSPETTALAGLLSVAVAESCTS